MINGCWTRACVDHEKYDVGLIDRRFRLRAHASGKAFRCRLFEPSRIYHRERNVAETGLALAPVARDTGPVVDQRQPSTDQSIEQGRFADIGSAHNDN